MFKYIDQLPCKVPIYKRERCQHMHGDGNRCQEDGLYEHMHCGMTVQVCDEHFPKRLRGRLK